MIYWFHIWEIRTAKGNNGLGAVRMMSFVEQGLMNVTHRDICEIKVDVDSKGIITNTRYISDVWGTRNVDLCPQTGGLDKLKYVLQPELYEYDKKH